MVEALHLSCYGRSETGPIVTGVVEIALDPVPRFLVWAELQDEFVAGQSIAGVSGAGSSAIRAASNRSVDQWFSRRRKEMIETGATGVRDPAEIAKIVPKVAL